MDILISNETDFELTPELKSLIELVAMRAVKRNNFEISVSLVDNKQIQAINKKYRKLDKPTDVLSFPQYGAGEEIPPQGAVLGDVIISIDKVYEQAQEYGHSFEREFGFLVAHGILHLLGYDHMDEASEKAMFELQEEILNICGLQKLK